MRLNQEEVRSFPKRLNQEKGNILAQSAKCSKPPPNVTLTMTMPLTLNHPQILKIKTLLTIQPNQSPVLRILKLKGISLYMHYLDTNIVTLVFVLLTNIDDNI